MPRKIASQKTRKAIAQRRFRDFKRQEPIFFDSPNKGLLYLVEVAEAIAKKYPIGELGQRGPKQTEAERKRECRGAKVLCNEILRISMANELSPQSPNRALFEKAKTILLRIFERTYKAHGDGSRVQLSEPERELFLQMGKSAFCGLGYALRRTCNASIAALKDAPVTEARHYLIWSATHLNDMSGRMETELFQTAQR